LVRHAADDSRHYTKNEMPEGDRSPSGIFVAFRYGSQPTEDTIRR
jgi:hypothetical protein